MPNYVPPEQYYPDTTDFLRGVDLLDYARETRGNKVLLQFSRGKDSIAMWLWLRENGFEIIPYTMSLVPGLGFQERSLEYYEQLFGQHIMRMMHPHFYYLCGSGIWMPPTDWAVFKQFKFDDTMKWASFATIDNFIADDKGLTNPLPWCMMGMRRAENLARMRLIDQQGVCADMKADELARRHFYPIWDWKIDDICDVLDKYNVKLPIDYVMFGRRGTTETPSYRRLKLIKERYPEDWGIMLEWFPLLDSQIFRYEQVGQ